MNARPSTSGPWPPRLGPNESRIRITRAAPTHGPQIVPAPPITTASNANAEVVKQLKSPEVSSRFAKVGVEPQTGTPEAFRDLIRTEVSTWAKVVKSANIKVE